MAARGRPREFDLDAALDRAAHVFWSLGYEGARLDDLTGAMGISRPSLYAAFGDKENIFRLAVERYGAVELGYFAETLAQTTAFDLASHYLHSVARQTTQPDKPHGCLQIQGGMAGGSDERRTAQFLAEQRRKGEALMADRFRQFIDHGDLPATENPESLAKYILATGSGLAVQAADGATREDLDAVADLALRTFPASLGPEQELSGTQASSHTPGS